MGNQHNTDYAKMSKSKAELPSTDVLVNPQRPVSGTTALNSLQH